MRKDTRIHLVEELEKLNKTPEIQVIIEEAKAGEYHDYKNQKYVCGKMEASFKLRNVGLIELAKRLENGEFDEECDEEDKEYLRKSLDQNGMSGAGYKKIFGL